MHTTDLPSRSMLRLIGAWGALALFVGLSTVTTPLEAQQPRVVRLRVIEDTTIVQEVQLRDGTKLVGRIVQIEGNEISFRTLGGLEMRFTRRDVRRVREVRGTQMGDEFWPDDPSNSRLFFAPTARVLAHGKGYVGVYELVFPSIAVGLGDVAMLSGGFSIIPGLSMDEQLYYFAPKVQLFDTKYVQGAIGAFWVKPGTDDDGGGLVYSGLTAGNIRASFSGGIAFPFASSGGFEDEPIVVLGGEARATRSLKAITETWIVPGEGAVLSFGFRILVSNVTVEAAAVTTTEGGFLPLVSFSVTW